MNGIKQITVFEVSNGARFNTIERAQEEEALLLAIEIAMHPLGHTPQAVRDGKGWVQHNPTTVAGVKRALLRLAKPQLSSYAWYCEDKFDEVHPHGIVGRILDDCNTPVSSAWSRLRRIDDLGREHQQQYFAINGPRAEHICLEERK